MTSCCEKKSCDMEQLAARQERVLWIVFSINILMFFVEITAGFYSASLSLLSDSLDMLGDSFAYGSSLYVLRMGFSAKAKSAIFKAWLIRATALFILLSAFYRVYFLQVPQFETMGVIGLLALTANTTCLLLLTRHRDDDVNMASVWLCSRNDIITNLSVVGAAYFVYWVQSPWPDLVVGTTLAGLYLHSARKIVISSR